MDEYTDMYKIHSAMSRHVKFLDKLTGTNWKSIDENITYY